MAGSPTDSIYDGGLPINTPLTLFLVQLVLVVGLSRVLAFFFKYIKQPTVIAEVVAGILLGPSALGRIDTFATHIFPNTSLPTFGVIANFGLIIFMFIIGLEIDTKLMKGNIGGAFLISVSAMITPFVLGLGSSYIIYHAVASDTGSFGNFLLFVGVAMSITAFPVLARILSELKLLETRVGNVALSSAAVDDVVAWCLLALVVAIARASKAIEALYTFLLLIGFVAFIFLVVRPILAAVAKSRYGNDHRLPFNYVVVLLILVYAFAWFTEIIGVHAIFGGFLLGVVVPRRNQFAHHLIERIEDFVVVILLPLYFTYSGLRTNIGSLNDAQSWGLVILVVTTACLGKITGATLAARFLKNSWRESFTIGILMNTKGLVELIVLNVGLDVGVLNTKVFTIFVIMALITTFVTTPLVHFVFVRHKEKYIYSANRDSYSILLGTKRSRSAQWLVKTVSNVFAHKNEKTTIKALLLKEISDRPSSYFYSEIQNMLEDASIVKSDKKALITQVKKKAPELSASLNISSKLLSSAQLEKDVANYANLYNYNLLVIDLYFHDSDKNGLEKQIDRPIESIMNLVPATNIIEYLAKHATCAFGVLSHRSHNLPEESKLEKIMLVYCGSPSEDVALETVKGILRTKTVNLTVRVKNGVEVNLDLPEEQKKELVNIISVENPLDEGIIDDSYDLILVGSSRRTDILHLPLLKNSEAPVLVLMPPKQTPITPQNSSFKMEPLRTIEEKDSTESVVTDSPRPSNEKQLLENEDDDSQSQKSVVNIV